MDTYKIKYGFNDQMHFSRYATFSSLNIHENRLNAMNGLVELKTMCCKTNTFFQSIACVGVLLTKESRVLFSTLKKGFLFGCRLLRHLYGGLPHLYSNISQVSFHKLDDVHERNFDYRGKGGMGNERAHTLVHLFFYLLSTLGDFHQKVYYQIRTFLYRNEGVCLNKRANILLLPRRDMVLQKREYYKFGSILVS
jgi:hypothetical protein